MTHHIRRLGGPATLAVVAFLTACSTSVVGTASPAGTPAQEPSDEPVPASAGPLDELLGGLPLHDELGEHLVVADLAAHPDGGMVLLARNGSSDDPDYVVRLNPAADGLELGDVHEIPSQPVDADLNTAPDGTIVVTSSGEERTSRPVFRLYVLSPDAAEPEQRIVTGLDQEEAPNFYDAVLSADGRTLYAGLAWAGPGVDIVPRMVAIDVATAAVTATQELPFEVERGAASLTDLALRPDGGLTALVLRIPDLDDDPLQPISLLVQFEAGLAVVGEPVELVGDGEIGRPRGLRLTHDGAAVVTLATGDDETRSVRVLVVRDGEVTDQFDLEEAEAPPWTVGLAPDDRYAYLPYGDESGQLVLGTLDLTTGDVVSTVPLCPAVDPRLYPALAELDADGRTVTVAAACTETGLVEAFRVG